MIFKDLEIEGVKFILPNKLEDHRGFFARSFCHDEFYNIGIEFSIKQTNISFNKNKGTIRGMHYQTAPYEEAKIVSCTQGSIMDYIIDLRNDSPSFGKWISILLHSAEYSSLYIPKGFAHGFKTLEENTIVNYLMGEFFKPEYARGIRWNDKYFNINWGNEADFIISEKDRNYPDFTK